MIEFINLVQNSKMKAEKFESKSFKEITLKY